MEYTDDNMQLVAEKVVLNMSLADLQAYVCEDYFFQFDQDSELFEDKVEELGLDKESEVEQDFGMKEIIGDDYPTYEDSVKMTLAEREQAKTTDKDLSLIHI